MNKNIFFDERLAFKYQKLINSSDIRAGDIAIFKTPGIIGFLIRIVTQSKNASHTGVIVGQNKMIHANAPDKGVVAIALSEYVARDDRIKAYIKRLKPVEWPQNEFENNNIKKIVDYLYRQIGKPYASLNVLGLLWRSLFRMIGLHKLYKIRYMLDRKRQRFFCSEIIVTAFKQAGVNLTNPRHPQDELTTPKDLDKSNKLIDIISFGA